MYYFHSSFARLFVLIHIQTMRGTEKYLSNNIAIHTA